MSLRICGRCGSVYAPARKCPHCGARDEGARFDWEEDMPKATVEGGASDYQAGAPGDGDGEPGAVPEVPEAPEAPSPRAPKADLVEHAVTVVGVDPETAQAMTKTELVETIAQAAPPPPPPPPPAG